jgi:transcription-repair coupling factor (superfamily II helicase)
VDVLTLTATPIPRTLHMSLAGIRDLSIIQTPPLDRQAIQVILARFGKRVIREAIMKEIERGGQVFFVQNRVQGIERMSTYIQGLVPEARIGVAHGQMKEGEIEEVMAKFVAGSLNVLVTTTIIESGIDIPSANTIIINRADRFGLAELYQIKGRVGRSRQKAYAYLLTPAEEALSDVARIRLRAIQELSELGAGFRIAAQDLETRGRQPSGQTAIGAHCGRRYRPLYPDDGRGHGGDPWRRTGRRTGHPDQPAGVGIHPRVLYRRHESPACGL